MMGGKSRKRKRSFPNVEKMREWDKMTELLRLVIGTGIVASARPVSLLLISEPGTGKTELLERFKPNPQLTYQSDMTWRGLMAILRRAGRLGINHIVFTEFQKLFQRKQSVAENCLGAIVQMIEEGIYEMGVGGSSDLGGIRLGIIGAITHGTMEKRREYLNETGFLSRAFVIPWEPPVSEIDLITRRITRGDNSDLQPIMLAQPSVSVHVDIPLSVGEDIRKFVWSAFRAQALRPLMRFRTLTASAALIRTGSETRIRATREDWEYVISFKAYWDNIVIGD